MIQDDSGGNEEERDQNENPKSPAANASQQETKVSSLSSFFVPALNKTVFFFSTLQYNFLGKPDKNTAKVNKVTKKSKWCHNNHSALR